MCESKSTAEQKKSYFEPLLFLKRTYSVPIESPPDRQRVRFDLWRGNTCVPVAGGPKKPCPPPTLQRKRESQEVTVSSSLKLQLCHCREIIPDGASVWGEEAERSTPSPQSIRRRTGRSSRAREDELAPIQAGRSIHRANLTRGVYSQWCAGHWQLLWGCDVWADKGGLTMKPDMLSWLNSRLLLLGFSKKRFLMDCKKARCVPWIHIIDAGWKGRMQVCTFKDFNRITGT